MMQLFIEGGWSMPLVLLVSLAALITAGLAAARPEARRIATSRALSQAALYAIAGGVAVNLAAVGAKAPGFLEGEKNGVTLAIIVLQGVSESLAPAVLGFPMLMLVALVLSAAVRRVEP